MQKQLKYYLYFKNESNQSYNYLLISQKSKKSGRHFVITQISVFFCCIYMCFSGETSDAIIFRKSRIKFHETYCTKLLIPRSLLFRHKDLKSLSRERSRAKIRNFKIVVQKSSFKTQQHTNLTYPFHIPKELL